MRILYVLFFLALSEIVFSQKRDIMIGALSQMDVTFQIDNPNFYVSESGKSSDQIEKDWRFYIIYHDVNAIEVKGENVIIDYNLEENRVVSKQITFNNFPDYFYFIQQLRTNHPNLKFEKTSSGNRYSFNENGAEFQLTSSFFYLENPNDNLDFKTLFIATISK